MAPIFYIWSKYRCFFSYNIFEQAIEKMNFFLSQFVIYRLLIFFRVCLSNYFTFEIFMWILEILSWKLIFSTNFTYYFGFTDKIIWKNASSFHFQIKLIKFTRLLMRTRYKTGPHSAMLTKELDSVRVALQEVLVGVPYSRGTCQQNCPTMEKLLVLDFAQQLDQEQWLVFSDHFSNS